MAMPKKKYQPKPAIGYINEVEVQGKKQRVINVTLELSELGLGTGQMKLVGFKNDFKTKDTQPDYNFRIAKERPSKGETKVTSEGSDFDL